MTGIPVGLSGLFQTRDLCYPAHIVFGKDCKSLYNDCFGPFFSTFHGGLVIPATPDCPELSNFQIIAPHDMSSIWKTTKKLFCYCCMCTNDLISVHKAGDNRCNLCKKLAITRCYCHPVNDETFLRGTQHLLETHVKDALDEGFMKLDQITSKSKINTNPLVANKHNNNTHIDFVPNSDSEVTKFKQLLKEELKLRYKSDRAAYQASLEGSFNDRRHRLKALIDEENRIHLARETLQKSESVRSIAEKVVLAEEAVPCILHLEMRINEKVFWTLLSLGIDRYQEGDLHYAKSCACFSSNVK
jgi:hypothetical protein